MVHKLITFIRRKRRSIIVVLIVGIAVAAYLYTTQNDTSEIRESATVRRGNLTQTLILSGSIQARESVSLHFLTGGPLVRLAVKEGDVVKKGQWIASLDQRQVKKNLEKQLNAFSKERYDLDDSRDTYEDDIISDSIKRILDKAQLDVDSAVLDVEIQNLALEYSHMYAPFAGKITSTHGVQQGTNVSALDAIVDIVNPASLYFELTADQTEVTLIKESMGGSLVLDAFENQPFDGSISHIGFTPKTNEASIVYPVTFSLDPLPSQDDQLRVGMTGDVTFITAQRNNVLSLPFRFVQEENERMYVQVMKNNSLEKVYITTGIETENDIEILSGLSEGDTVYD